MSLRSWKVESLSFMNLALVVFGILIQILIEDTQDGVDLLLEVRSLQNLSHLF
jgi:hypothetical protein